MADKFHTYSLRSIFRQVHALAKNVFDLIFRYREKFCEAFLTDCNSPRQKAWGVLYLSQTTITEMPLGMRVISACSPLSARAMANAVSRLGA